MKLFDVTKNIVLVVVRIHCFVFHESFNVSIPFSVLSGRCVYFLQHMSTSLGGYRSITNTGG